MNVDSDALWEAGLQYGSVFGLLLAAGFGFPMPEEIPVATGGVIAGHASEDSLIRWWIMLPLCMLGVVLSDGVLYTIGRYWGPELFQKRWVKRILPPEKQVKIRQNFNEYGIWILLIARLTPGFRTPVFMMAGITKMPITRFLFADMLYAIPGVIAIFSMGYWFGERFLDLVKQLGEYKSLVMFTLLAFGLGFVAGWYTARGKVATGDPEQIPIIGREVAHLAHRHLHHEETNREHKAPPSAQESSQELERLSPREALPAPQLPSSGMQP